MTFEISDKQYEKKLNWYDGMLYCSLRWWLRLGPVFVGCGSELRRQV